MKKKYYFVTILYMEIIITNARFLYKLDHNNNNIDVSNTANLRYKNITYECVKIEIFEYNFHVKV